MKHRWVAYFVVGLLSVGVGTAIAGSLDTSSADPTIDPPETAEESVVVTTIDPDRLGPPATPSTLVVQDPLPSRRSVSVVVANGSGIPGLALETAGFIEFLGYGDVTATEGSEIARDSVLYYAEGQERVAARLGIDLQLEPILVLPRETAPDVSGEFDDDVLFYVGLDQT